MRARKPVVRCVCAAGVLAASLAAGQNPDRRQLQRLEQAVEREGRAIVDIADRAGDEPLPADFQLTWRNDFLKAQGGTFVPFVVGITTPDPKANAALLYIRVARRDPVEAARGRRPPVPAVSYAFEEIYPVDLSGTTARTGRVTRGFSVDPGDYDVTVVVRERERDLDRGRRPLTAVLRRALTVPDFSGPELTTSTVILADRVSAAPGPPGNQEDHPYLLGGRDIEPAADSSFRRADELIVVFLVYNPSVTPDKHFDLEVEYHFFRKSRDEPGAQPLSKGGRPIPAAQPGEAYVNRTEPQRFNPALLGPGFQPETGQPVLAGQGIPLAGFLEGDYRLAIRVTDLVSGHSIERHVLFSVHS